MNASLVTVVSVLFGGIPENNLLFKTSMSLSLAHSLTFAGSNKGDYKSFNPMIIFLQYAERMRYTVITQDVSTGV